MNISSAIALYYLMFTVSSVIPCIQKEDEIFASLPSRLSSVSASSFPHCRPFLLSLCPSRIEVFTEPIVRPPPPLVTRRSLLCSALRSDPRERAAAAAGESQAARGRARASGWGRSRRRRTDGYETPAGAGRSLAPSPLAKNPSGGARSPRAFLDQIAQFNVEGLLCNVRGRAERLKHLEEADRRSRRLREIPSVTFAPPRVSSSTSSRQLLP